MPDGTTAYVRDVEAQTSISSLSSSLTQTQSDVTQAKTDIDSLKAEDTTINQSISSLSSQVQANSDSIASLTAGNLGMTYDSDSETLTFAKESEGETA